jgi:hypothetical protein
MIILTIKIIEGTPEKTLPYRFAGSVFVKNNPPKIIIIGGNLKLKNN